MATAEAAAKTAPESGGTSMSRPTASFLCADLVLRLLLFAVSLSALVVLVTAKQTVFVPVALTPRFRFAPVAAQFKDSPAFIYLLVALCMTCLYSLLTAASALKSIGSSVSSAKTLFLLVLLDMFYVAIVASATGAAGGVAWVGLKGNSHTRWNKICNVYGKFCRHIGSSTLLGVIASLLLLVLTAINTYSLYRRSR